MLPTRVTMPATLLGLILAAQSAQADLTPEQVWEDWRSYIGGFGNEVSATETLSGDSLVVSDVLITTNIPEDQGSATVEMGTLTFTSNGDGTVDISLAEVMPIVSSAIAEGEEVSYTLDFVNSGFTMTAAGDASAIEYNYSADSFGLNLTSLSVNGETIPPEGAQFEMTASGVSGQSKMENNATRSYTQSFSAETIAYTAAFSDPDSSEKLNVNASANSVRYDGTGTVPIDAMTSDDIADMMAAGFGLEGTFSFASGQSVAQSSGQNGGFAANTASQGGQIGVNLGGSGISYDVQQSNLSVDVTTDQVPFPISFTLENGKFNLTMPLVESEEVQDFGVGLTLAGFTMSDMLWGIFDPTGQLPRDPATVAFDMSGKGRLLFDFLDPAAATVSGNPNITPAEVEAVDINAIEVSVAGAALTGSGAFTFVNAPGAMPQPNGAVDLQLAGANGLLDKLVAIGLLPEEQAMGARMMMGLFAVPGAEPDTLNSRIEVNEQGHVIANGQRIQ